MSCGILPITFLFKSVAKFTLTLHMEITVRERTAELSAPFVLAFPDWETVADGSRPFRVYSHASTDMLASIILVLSLGRSSPTAPCDRSPAPVALPSTRRDPELRSTWKHAALYEPSGFFEAFFGARNPAYVRTTKRWRMLPQLGPQLVISALAQVPRRCRLSIQVQQRGG